MLRQLHEHAAGGRRMEESDAFALGAESGLLVDQSQPCTTTAFQCSVQIVDGEADMVNAAATLGDEFADRRIGGLRLEELDQRFTGAVPRDAGTVGIVEGLFGQAEQVAVERNDTIELCDGDSDVRYAGAFGHSHQSIEGTSTIEDARHG